MRFTSRFESYADRSEITAIIKDKQDALFFQVIGDRLEFGTFRRFSKPQCGENCRGYELVVLNRNEIN